MQISMLAVGRLKAGPEGELFERYLQRARKAGRALGFRGFHVREVPEGRAGRAADRLAEEEKALLAARADFASLICLDENGDLLDSRAFAALLNRRLAASLPESCFVIGGPDGLGHRLLAAAGHRIAFGRVTWPHQIVRILLAEQLYRAMTILSGHPYHRA